ncbi:YjiH family protein [Tissierellaceae bacterium HCP3S3_D8]
MDIPKTNQKGSVMKFILFAVIGILLFFFPITDGQIPVVFLVNTLEMLLGNVIDYIVLISTVVLAVTYLMARFGSNEKLKEFHKSNGVAQGILYVMAAIIVIMLVFNIGPAPLLNPDVGGLTLSLAGTVFITVTIAGWLVVFITKSGIVDFIGILIELIMRPLYKLPGEAAVNAITGFVSNAAVGVYFTNSLYEDNVYTEKETIAVLTNFSVCSIGFFGVLVSMGDIVHLYSQVVLTSLIATFIMGIIVIRIPPISHKRNVYRNGIEQTKEALKEKKDLNQQSGNRFKRALDTASVKSEELTVEAFFGNLKDALTFGQSIVGYVLSIGAMALLLTEYTPLFDYLGKPMAPILNFFGLEYAAAIAPATLIGIAEISLPAILVAGQGIAESSVFFIVVLSSVQVINFSESAMAMLGVDVPLNAGELVVMFIIRTLIAIPIIALMTSFLF